MSNRRQITCSSCGAVFDELQPKCPYCGSTNFLGAEKEYMDELENIREDLEDLPEEELKQGSRIRGKQILRIVLGFLLLLCTIFIIYTVCTRIDEKNKMNLKEEIIYETGE